MLQFFNTENDTVKTKHLLVQSYTSHSDTQLKDFKNGKAIYIVLIFECYVNALYT